ncbi:MAG: hypothetical protein LBQ31_00950 [Bacteroidales bacterium]|nr:hypothetical protein [Bacteroidales bacterium]
MRCYRCEKGGTLRWVWNGGLAVELLARGNAQFYILHSTFYILSCASEAGGMS